MAIRSLSISLGEFCGSLVDLWLVELVDLIIESLSAFPPSMGVLFSQLGTARNQGFTIDHGLKDVKIIEKVNGIEPSTIVDSP